MCLLGRYFYTEIIDSLPCLIDNVLYNLQCSLLLLVSEHTSTHTDHFKRDESS